MIAVAWSCKYRLRMKGVLKEMSTILSKEENPQFDERLRTKHHCRKTSQVTSEAQSGLHAVCTLGLVHDCTVYTIYSRMPV